jgi:hypothetical protein
VKSSILEHRRFRPLARLDSLDRLIVICGNFPLDPAPRRSVPNGSYVPFAAAIPLHSFYPNPAFALRFGSKAGACIARAAGYAA